MAKQKIFARASLLGAVFAGAVLPNVANAQDVDSNEIIVTAQKREQNIQDIGVAVTALGQDQLDMMGTGDVVALTKQVPNLGVNTYAPSQVAFNIRGVAQNDFADGQEGPIAFYNDEVYIAALGGIAGNFFDLQRVEVLRGPQGTLFGRNATGGLVQVVTAKPSDEFGGFVTVTGGSFNQIATEAAITGPLSDSVNGRLLFTSDNHDGYYENSFGPDLADANFWGARGQLDFDLSPHDRLNLKVEYLVNDEEVAGAQTYAPASPNPANHDLGRPLPAGTPGGPVDPRISPVLFDFINSDPDNGIFVFAPNPLYDPSVTYTPTAASGDVYEAFSNFPGLFDREFINLAARFEHDFGDVTLTSITSYQNLNKRFNEDLDALPFDYLNVIAGQYMNQASQELRLSGDTETLNWVVGAYAMRINNEFTAQAPSPGFTAFSIIPGFPTSSFYVPHTGNFADLTTTSVAIFGQTEWTLSDQFSLIAGARYSQDDKHQDYTAFNIPLLPGNATHLITMEEAAALSPFPLTTYSPDETFSGWSGKLELDYRPNADTLLYVGINRGLKSGGFVTPNFDPVASAISSGDPIPTYDEALDQLTFENEVLTSYEAGYKLTLNNGRTRFNGSAFYYDYQDYQAFFTVGLNNLVVNYPATISGAEFELFMNPIDPLNFGLFVTYMNEAEVEGFVLPNDDIVDRRIPHTPEWSVGFNASYDFALGDAGTLRVATNWKWEDEFYHSTSNSEVEHEPAYTVGDVRVSFTPTSGAWELAAFVNNVADEEYRVYASDFSTLDSAFQNGGTGTGNGMYAPPRWYGASLTYRFGAQ